MDEVRKRIRAAISSLEQAEMLLREDDDVVVPKPEPSSDVVDTGRKTDAGHPVYMYAKRPIANNASGDLCNVSPSGRYIALMDSTRQNHNVAVDTETMQVIDMVPYGFAGAANEFPHWSDDDHFWYVSRDGVGLSPLKGNSRLYFDLTPRQWRAGIGIGKRWFCYAGDQVVSLHEDFQPTYFSLRTEYAPTATRIHNPHPTDAGLITSLRGTNQSDLFYYSWTGIESYQLAVPFDMPVIHPTFNASGQCAFTQNGTYDGYLVFGHRDKETLKVDYAFRLRDHINPAIYRQFQHGVLQDDGTLYFTGTTVRDGVIWCTGIYRAKFAVHPEIERVVDIDTISGFNNGWNPIPRLSGGNGWITWNEGDATRCNAYFARIE